MMRWVLCLGVAAGCGDVVANQPDAPTSVDAPADMPVGSGVRSVAAGPTHSCAVFEDDSLVCWGNNRRGQLGYGNTNAIGDTETPASAGLVQVGAPVSSVAVGNEFTCALLKSGTVRCWGANTSGQLGVGNTNDVIDARAAIDVELNGQASAISAGFDHACAIVGNGALICWGNGRDGALGYGNLNSVGDDEKPNTAGVVNVGGRVSRVAACGGRTCAVADGNAHCWGRAPFAGVHGLPGAELVLGDNEVPSMLRPIKLGLQAVDIACGIAESCAVVDDSSVRCWGDNTFGQLGYGNRNVIGDDEDPIEVVQLTAPARQITVGNTVVCALLTNSEVQCWGFGGAGTLGYGNTNNIGDDELPTAAGTVDVGGPVSALAMSASVHVCALQLSGAVRCWGDNSLGQLGQGNTVRIGDDERPSAINPIQLR